ncbi:deoxyribonuclease IV [candidate division KSB1 bacterium]|nr:deoxyribonuclease IV [candidate division KSB1 bacterium]
MLLGAHVSIAGGLYNAPARGVELGCTAIQIFTKNQVQWQAPPLAEDDIQKYKTAYQASGIKAVCAHDSYLINIGSSEPALLHRSRKAFIDEIQRAHRLEIPYLVFHPGAYKGGDEKDCLQIIAESINFCFDQIGKTSVQVLLETTAGQGTSVGYRFEQLREIIDRVQCPENIGVCLDTCHIFAAGYDLRDESAYQKTMLEFDEIIGLDHLKVIHLNDAKKKPGSRVDRHENIGLGTIGEVAFQLIMNDDRLANIPKILETPGGDEWFMKNLALLRSMVPK